MIPFFVIHRARYKIRPPLTTSKEGLVKLNIHLVTACKQTKILINCILTVLKLVN
jgi:hypothetical protein